MGFNAWVVGETVTPGIAEGDLLLIGSGSGETASLVSAASKAKKIGVSLGLISIYPDSTIGRQADVLIKINAQTPKGKTESGFTSIQPMGSMFEQSLLIVFDALILRLMERLGKNSETMFGRHANLE
jgi:6-phospho-3-hexuloisomerase